MKNLIKKTVLKTLLDRGILVGRSAESGDVKSFIDRFRQNYISTRLTRIGEHGDGGYLLPDILDDVTCCFSPGVSTTATFETSISESHGIRSFLADASVDAPPVEDGNFEFDKKFLGNRDDGDLITLQSWMDQKVAPSVGNMLLQMDIEGAEYDVLAVEPMQTLRRFCCIIVEFHGVDRIFDPYFLKIFSSLFEKLFQDFSICHVHPNNLCGMASGDGVDVPRVMEVTFLRNDFAERLTDGNPISLPHALDDNNVSYRPTLLMPSAWWE